MTWRWSLLRWRIKFDGISFSEIEGLIWRLNDKIVTLPFVFLAELFLFVVYLVSVCNFECLRAPVLCKRLCVCAWIVSFLYVRASFSLYNCMDSSLWKQTRFVCLVANYIHIQFVCLVGRYFVHFLKQANSFVIWTLTIYIIKHLRLIRNQQLSNMKIVLHI